MANKKPSKKYTPAANKTPPTIVINTGSTSGSGESKSLRNFIAIALGAAIAVTGFLWANRTVVDQKLSEDFLARTNDAAEAAESAANAAKAAAVKAKEAVDAMPELPKLVEKLQKREALRAQRDKFDDALADAKRSKANAEKSKSRYETEASKLPLIISEKSRKKITAQLLKNSSGYQKAVKAASNADNRIDRIENAIAQNDKEYKALQ